MAFTDAQLAGAMKGFLVTSELMTQQQQDILLENSTESNVGETLSAQQLTNFGAYWQALGAWMAGQGGNIATTTGTNAPGRQGGNPAGLQLIPLYNDTFNDVNAHLNQSGWKPGKAVANQLRFVSVLGNPPA
ncbi:hypothetical protein [Hymenobacter arizonensis]|uniref:Uncharacterized protein n=1 Tax=Hymenobacter arizonensis TaxID=1227077 RepID=A0A1I6BFG0_HYMAR|nr:hypothetical protein [Hymenobacter arizonensis]SFQ79688.1 hypothetical protein SAMN04515668_4482 [Hymenobacter arizonensis]